MDSPNLYDLIIKLVLVGDSSVGKTSIRKFFCEKTYPGNQNQTIGLEFDSRIIELGDTKLKLTIWDTAGQEKFFSMTKNYFRSSSIIFLIFDITNRDSFCNLSKWIETSIEYSPSTSIKFLIGNKIDLFEKRTVSFSEALDYAISYNFKYFETSAFSGEKIEDIFFSAANEIIFLIKEGKIYPDYSDCGVYNKRIQNISENNNILNKNCCN